MTPLPLLVLEAGSDTKFSTISANPTLWTLFGSHKGLGAASDMLFVIMSLCHDLSLGLVTKARAWKGAGQKCNPGITFTLLGVRENVRE
jgi:hypothetical protein